MPKSFVPSDLLNYQSEASIAATRVMAACVVEQPDEAGDVNSSMIWLVPLDGAAPWLFTAGYGSYLSAWAMTQTDIFKAAVVSAPVSNIESHRGTSDSGYYVTPYAMCGEPFADDTAARRLSPLDHMHKVRTPTLLLQGKYDQRCPVGQSEEIFAGLMHSSDVAVEMVLYPDGDHHLAEEGAPRFRIDYVTRLVDWVERWANRTDKNCQNPGNAKQGRSGADRGEPEHGQSDRLDCP